MSNALPRSARMPSPFPTTARQLDWAAAPLDILPEARAAVGRRITIFVDGAMRRGTDIIKALILGADAFLVGRAALYGVAAAGMPGVKRALDILQTELAATWACWGSPRWRALPRELLIRRGPGPYLGDPKCSSP
jgi:isopentenyl diphosphate isomerase/L-lactate dehydrogenase-like FMN-dependent dehydrogenase